jgi:hypothetical protein
VVEVIARHERSVTRLLEQRHALLAGVQEDLSFVFPVHAHAEDVGVKLLGLLHVAHVEHDVVDTDGLDHFGTQRIDDTSPNSRHSLRHESPPSSLR